MCFVKFRLFCYIHNFFVSYFEFFWLCFKKSLLRSRNYLFSAPTLTIILAPAPAKAIYWHFKLF